MCAQVLYHDPYLNHHVYAPPSLSKFVSRCFPATLPPGSIQPAAERWWWRVALPPSRRC